MIANAFAPKSTPESEALVEKIDEVHSKIKVGINYIDYGREAQDIQILKDKLEKSKKSDALRYRGNLMATAENLIEASRKESREDWDPQFLWEQSGITYLMMEACQTKGEHCTKDSSSARMSAIELKLEELEVSSEP